MVDVTAPPMFSLPDVAIGGLIGICGVLVAQLVAMIQSRLEREHKKHVLFRTKYEEMATAFLDSLKWPSSLLYATSLEQIADLSVPAAANKVHMLCTVYFLPLLPASGAYIEACVALYDASVSLYNPSDNRPLGEQAFNHPQYKAARDAYFAAKDIIQTAIQDYARSYTVA